MRILIKGARVLDPSQELDAERNLLVENGRVSDLLQPGTGPAEGDVRVVEAAGLLLVPGLIDIHVHLREPGEEYKETIASGAAAAAAGGFTAVAAMPNTRPVNDQVEVAQFILARAREAGRASVLPVAAMTKGLEGREMCEYGFLAETGVKAVSDDGRWVADGRLMRRILEYAASFGLTPISHAEDYALSTGGCMNEGLVSTQMGLAGIPAAAEASAVMRDLSLAALTGTKIHIAHVSTAEAVAAVRRAKEDGVRVTAETAPHYFTLTEEAVRGYRTNAKMNPPLRTRRDMEAVRQGLADGTIDCIATDHAPHSELEKDLEFDRAAFGVVGLETSLALALDLVREGVIDLQTLVRLMSRNPAAVLDLPGGSLKPGRPADLTLIDLDRTWTVDPEAFVSKGRNTPFAGRPLTGRAVLTMVAGRIVHALSPIEV